MTQIAQTQSLADLVDITLPGVVPYIPQTGVWYVLFVAIAAGAAYGAYRWLRLWRGNRYRRDALAELVRLEAAVRLSQERPAALAAIPTLLRRTALSVFPRVRVASITNEHWLEFLQKTGGSLDESVGTVLTQAIYWPPDRLASIPEAQALAVVRAVRGWVVAHRA